MMPQFLRASCFALPLSREKAQHKRDIKIFYHYQEKFSINFHIFIHKNYAHPISLRQRLFTKGRQKGSFGTDERPGKAPFAGIVCNDPAGTKIFAKNQFRIKGISGWSAQEYSY